MNAHPKTSSVAVRTVVALARHEAAATAAPQTTGQWRAAAWTSHAKTTVLADDTTAPTGKHVIAECDTEKHAQLLAAAPQLLATLELIEQVTRGKGLAAADCQATLRDIGKAARAVIALVQP